MHTPPKDLVQIMLQTASLIREEYEKERKLRKIQTERYAEALAMALTALKASHPANGDAVAVRKNVLKELQSVIVELRQSA